MIDQENIEYYERWKMKNMLNKMSSVRGNGTSLITLIIAQGTQLSRVQTMLLNEIGTASNIKDHTNKLSVQGGIRSAQERLKLYKEIPKNGLVICVGIILVESNKEKKIVIDFEPFKPIKKFIYRCDNKFHLDELNDLLNDNIKYGFIIIDGKGTLYGIINGDNKVILNKFSVDLPKKHGRGGQSQMRFLRIRQEKRQNYLTKVSEKANEIFLENELPNVEGLIIAGSSLLKKQLAEYDKFDQRLKKVIINIVDIQYGDEMGFDQAISLSKDKLTNIKFVREDKLLTDFFHRIGNDQDRVCYGKNDTLYALEAGAIDKLLLWTESPIRRILAYNNNTGKDEILYLNKNEQLDVNYEIKYDIEFIEWILDIDENKIPNYKQYGIVIELISNKTQLGSQFIHGFGGIGGLLRFNLEYPQETDEDVSFDSEDFI